MRKRNQLLHINILGDSADPINEPGLHHSSHKLDIALVSCWCNPIKSQAAQRAALGSLKMGQGILQ